MHLSGRQLPPNYRGELIFGNLHGHRLVHDHVVPNGSGIYGGHRADLLRSNDHWFIPIQQKVGPDGALYVSDWSDKQVCTRQQCRGHVGPEQRRIYRISYDRLEPWRKGGSKDAGSKAVGLRAIMEQCDGDLGKLADDRLAVLAVRSEKRVGGADLPKALDGAGLSTSME